MQRGGCLCGLDIDMWVPAAAFTLVLAAVCTSAHEGARRSVPAAAYLSDREVECPWDPAVGYLSVQVVAYR
jgi:hypothetical protein